jgi:hypothetical protein
MKVNHVGDESKYVGDKDEHVGSESKYVGDEDKHLYVFSGNVDESELIIYINSLIINVMKTGLSIIAKALAGVLIAGVLGFWGCASTSDDENGDNDTTFDASQNDPFYYYKGEKIYLKTDFSRLSIVSRSEVNTDNIGNVSIANKNTEKSYTSQNVIPLDAVDGDILITEIEFSAQVDETEYLNIIQQLQKEENVIKASPTYTFLDKKLGISNYFYVKLFKEGDKPLLYNLAKKHSIQVVGYNEFMPLWYTLSCSKETPLNVIDVANLFYETGLFESAEPEFLYHDLLLSNESPDESRMEEIPFTEYLIGESCRWINLKFDEKILVISSKVEMEKYISRTGGDFSEIDFSKQSLLLASGKTTNGIAAISKKLLKSENMYTLEIKVELNDATVIGQWVVAIVTDKLDTEINAEIKTIRN